MSFPAYVDTKISSVQWLGRVPLHWDVALVKRYLTVKSGDMISANEEAEQGIPIIGGNGFRAFTSKSNTVGNTLVIGRVGAQCGCVHHITEDFWASEHAFRVEERKPLSKRFFFYLLSAINLNQFAIKTAQPLLNTTIVESQWIAAPTDIAEQTAIASFLDTETSKIDGLVSEQRRLIELLKEKRQAVISHAVTKGLNPDVKMKPSGILWLGDVPEHWEVRKLGACTTITRLAGAEYTAFWQVDDSGSIVTLRGQNIRPYSLDLANCERISEELSQKLVRSRLFKGDVVYPCVGSIGNAAMIEHDNQFHINQNIAKLTPVRSLLDSSFLTHFLNSVVALESALYLNTSDAQPSILVGNLRKVKIPLPPLPEQEEIAEYLSVERVECDLLLTQAERAIELLQERRTALISAAVTGKIDVRGYVAEEVAA